MMPPKTAGSLISRIGLVGGHAVLFGLTLLMGTGCINGPVGRRDAPEFAISQSPWEFRGRPGKKITTDHFDIYTTITDVELREHIPGYLESAYRYYRTLIPRRIRDEAEPTRLRVYLFDSRRGWDAYVRRTYPQRYPLYRRIAAGGFSEGETCVVYNIGRGATLSLLAHEGWHQYVAQNVTERIPAWINEGLATYCESVDFKAGPGKRGADHNPFRMNHLCDTRSRGTALPLRRLLATDAGRVLQNEENSESTAYYARAWALVVYLRHGGDRALAEGFERLLADLALGSMQVHAQAAQVTAPEPGETSYGEAVFRAYFGRDPAEMESEFVAFIDDLCWKR